MKKDFVKFAALAVAAVLSMGILTACGTAQQESVSDTEKVTDKASDKAADTSQKDVQEKEASSETAKDAAEN